MDLNDWKISRRSFIKWTAAAGAVLGLEGIVGKAHAKKHRILAKPKGLKSKEVLVFAQNVDSPEERYNIPTFSPGDELDLSQYLDFVDIKVPDPELGSRKDLKNHAYLQDILANEPTKGKITSEESLNLGYGTYSTWIAVYNGKKKRQEAVRLVFAVVPTDGALKELKDTFGLKGEYNNLERMMPDIRKAVKDLKEAAKGKVVDIKKFSELKDQLNGLAYDYAQLETQLKLSESYDSFLGVELVSTKNDVVSTPGAQPLRAQELYQLAETLGPKNIAKYLSEKGKEIKAEHITQEGSKKAIAPGRIAEFYAKVCHNFFSLPPKKLNGLLRTFGDKRASKLLTLNTIEDDNLRNQFVKRVVHENEWIGNHSPTSAHDDLSGKWRYMKVSDLDEKTQHLFKGKGVGADSLEEGEYLGAQLSIMPRNLENQLRWQKYTIEITGFYKKPNSLGKVKKKIPVLLTYDELARLEEISGNRRFTKENIEGYLVKNAGKKNNDYDGKRVAQFLATLPETRIQQFFGIGHKYGKTYTYKEDGQEKTTSSERSDTIPVAIRHTSILSNGITRELTKDDKLYGFQYLQDWELVKYNIKVKANPHLRSPQAYRNQLKQEVAQVIDPLRQEITNSPIAKFAKYFMKKAA